MLQQLIIGITTILIGYFLLKFSDARKGISKDILIILGFIILLLGIYFFAYGIPGTKEARDSFESKQSDQDHGAGFY